MKNIQTIAVTDKGSAKVQVVTKEDLPIIHEESAQLPVTDIKQAAVPAVAETHKVVVKEAKRREKYIQSIKKFVTEPYDNINNPVPFIPSRA